MHWDFCQPLACCSLSYSAAAVITNEDGVDDVPYLDKFTVGRKSQVLIRQSGEIKKKVLKISLPRASFWREDFHGNFILMFSNCRKCLHKNNPQPKENWHCFDILNVAALMTLKMFKFSKLQTPTEEEFQKCWFCQILCAKN